MNKLLFKVVLPLFVCLRMGLEEQLEEGPPDIEKYPHKTLNWTSVASSVAPCPSPHLFAYSLP